METTLQGFVDGWRREYVLQQRAIPLFKPELTARFTLAQQRAFIVIFDELRRHFTGLLGHLAELAPQQSYKRVLRENWIEENGVGGAPGLKSHDHWYRLSARALGINILKERLGGCAKRPYTEKFNRRFFQWIIRQIVIYGWARGWQRIWAAYCAYELLDNVDYPAFLKMAESFGLTGKALKFFEIHCAVEHYGQGRKLLEAIWHRHPEDVRAGFAFIKQLQLTAFKALSEELMSA